MIGKQTSRSAPGATLFFCRFVMSRVVSMFMHRFSIARLTRETKCFACVDAVIRMIPFEPRMDVPVIWEAKNRLAVILTFIVVSIAR